MSGRALAALYSGIAEALAPTTLREMPLWLCAPGREWPLFEPAVDLAKHRPSSAFEEVVVAMAEVPAGSRAERWREYESLFIGPGTPKIWPYESYYREGRVPGSRTFTVKALYDQVGLEIVGGELADHASLELAFLVYLENQEASDPVQSETWREARRLFLKQHAGEWLPEVGRALKGSGYPVWSAIGVALCAIMQPEKTLRSTRPRRNAKFRREQESRLPVLDQPDACSLCGFCVQVCPVQALWMLEDKESTALWLRPWLCVGCDKCEKVCHENVLTLKRGNGERQAVLLRRSPRNICPGCGAPTVSRAEIDTMASRIGRPPWLFYCLECRAQLGDALNRVRLIVNEREINID
jgi:TorA maturation chaperone TorD